MKRLALLMLTVTMIFTIQSPVFAKSNAKTDADLKVENHIKNVDKVLGTEMFDKAMQQFDHKYFKYFNFSDNGTITLKENNLSSKEKKQAEKTMKQFEKVFKDYVKRINKYNKKKGLDTKAFQTDEKGNLTFGSKGGSTGTNNFTVSGLAKGDIVLLDDDGSSIQGEINHGGIYDGTDDYYSIYTAEPDLGVTWEAPSIWRNHDTAYSYKTILYNSVQADAFDYMKSYASVGEDYEWYTSKSNTSNWYCTKLPYYGYEYGEGLSIDGNGGYWAKPDDITSSNNVYLYKGYY